MFGELSTRFWRVAGGALELTQTKVKMAFKMLITQQEVWILILK